MPLQIGHIKESIVETEANRRVAILREWEAKTRESPEEAMTFAVVHDRSDMPGWAHIDAHDKDGNLLGHVFNFGAVDWKAALGKDKEAT